MLQKKFRFDLPITEKLTNGRFANPITLTIAGIYTRSEHRFTEVIWRGMPITEVVGHCFSREVKDQIFAATENHVAGCREEDGVAMLEEERQDV